MKGSYTMQERLPESLIEAFADEPKTESVIRVRRDGPSEDRRERVVYGTARVNVDTGEVKVDFEVDEAIVNKMRSS